eukprot:CAMPEP_0168858388 /NCGR_PEP_ID=MMETSP0727-20121128/16261_1 /TAXON_ID=265536 /ORGANISM="Amphiprora sp., Strain CCMP467" /LENGTH=58 /DNA_ID=CAMNT_0008913129 /DNA_START=75 /DNA_END=251 /DNA_ORIENTATION=-
MTMKEFAKFALASSTTTAKGSGLGFGCMGITSFYGDAMSDEAASKFERITTVIGLLSC